MNRVRAVSLVGIDHDAPVSVPQVLAAIYRDGFNHGLGLLHFVCADAPASKPKVDEGKTQDDAQARRDYFPVALVAHVLTTEARCSHGER